jgi:hypothetical protein
VPLSMPAFSSLAKPRKSSTLREMTDSATPPFEFPKTKFHWLLETILPLFLDIKKEFNLLNPSITSWLPIYLQYSSLRAGSMGQGLGRSRQAAGLALSRAVVSPTERLSTGCTTKTDREAAMRRFMMTVMALVAFGAMVATAQAENHTSSSPTASHPVKKRTVSQIARPPKRAVSEATFGSYDVCVNKALDIGLIRGEGGFVGYVCQCMGPYRVRGTPYGPCVWAPASPAR